MGRSAYTFPNICRFVCFFKVNLFHTYLGNFQAKIFKPSIDMGNEMVSSD